MAHITITPETTRFQINASGTVLGETVQALRLKEGNYPPALYVPRSDINMNLLQKTERQTTCPHKGLCSYYSIKTPNGVLENAVWSYESPIGAVAEIAGHFAFYPDKVSVTAV